MSRAGGVIEAVTLAVFLLIVALAISRPASPVQLLDPQQVAPNGALLWR